MYLAKSILIDWASLLRRALACILFSELHKRVDIGKLGGCDLTFQVY